MQVHVWLEKSREDKQHFLKRKSGIFNFFVLLMGLFCYDNIFLFNLIMAAWL